MSTSEENKSGTYNIIVITVFLDDELMGEDKRNLYRDLWGWFEKQCITPKGMKIE